jgi:hypothetical protein
MKSSKQFLKYQPRRFFHRKKEFDANHHGYVVDKKLIDRRHAVGSSGVGFWRERDENLNVSDNSESFEG